MNNKCPACGRPAYVGLTVIDCDNPECRHYVEKVDLLDTKERCRNCLGTMQLMPIASNYGSGLCGRCWLDEHPDFLKQPQPPPEPPFRTPADLGRREEDRWLRGRTIPKNDFDRIMAKFDEQFPERKWQDCYVLTQEEMDFLDSLVDKYPKYAYSKAVLGIQGELAQKGSLNGKRLSNSITIDVPGCVDIQNCTFTNVNANHIVAWNRIFS